MQDPKPGHVPETHPVFAATAMVLFLLLLAATGVYKTVKFVASLF